MLASDQSRIPPGRSIRLTSSPVNGAYFARQAQKSSANLIKESGCVWLLANRASELKKTLRRNFSRTDSIRGSAHGNDRWRKTRAIHRHAVAERGGFIARVANMIQLVIPAFHVRAIRRFLAAGNRNVTILSECEKRRFARQRIWRSPVR